MLGSSGSNNYGFNPSQADTDTLFKNLGINTVKQPVKQPVKQVKKAASNMGLGITLGGNSRQLIKQDAKAGNITDPVQYTLNLINKAKTQNMSNSQQWVNQRANKIAKAVSVYTVGDDLWVEDANGRHWSFDREWVGIENEFSN